MESEQKVAKWQELPKEVLVLVCGFLIEDKKAKEDTIKVFVALDNFRLSSKSNYAIVGILIKNFASKKSESMTDQAKKLEEINSYNYLKFKQEYMIDLWDRKINNIVLIEVYKDNPDPILKKIRAALNLKAYFWSKRQIKNNEEYEKRLKGLLSERFSAYDTFAPPKGEKLTEFNVYLKKLLDLGVGANSEIHIDNHHTRYWGGMIYLTVMARDVVTTKLLLDYGADPNLVSSWGGSITKGTPLSFALTIKNVELCKLFLENGPLKADQNMEIIYEEDIYGVGIDRMVNKNHLAYLFWLRKSGEVSPVELIKLLLKNGAAPLNTDVNLYKSDNSEHDLYFCAVYHWRFRSWDIEKGRPDIDEVLNLLKDAFEAWWAKNHKSENNTN